MSTPVKKRPATLEDLARLRDEGHAVELVEGEIVYKAMPSPEHGSAQAKIAALLDPFHRRGGPKGPGGWWIMLEVEVFYAQTGETFRHDACGFRRDRHARRPEGPPIRERADWVCEVLSPSNARRDIVQKQRTMHRQEVPHYWIVDPEHQILSVLRWNEGAYTHVLEAGLGDVVRAEPFEAIEISIAELFGREE
jgi:Uma2 family endonuclease